MAPKFRNLLIELRWELKSVRSSHEGGDAMVRYLREPTRVIVIDGRVSMWRVLDCESLRNSYSVLLFLMHLFSFLFLVSCFVCIRSSPSLPCPVNDADAICSLRGEDLPICRLTETGLSFPSILMRPKRKF